MLETSNLNLSLFEQNCLAHFPDRIDRPLFKALTTGVMVFRNILPDLYHKGIRLRIAPLGKKVTQIHEFQNLEGNPDYENALGLYSPNKKTIAILAKELLYRSHVNQRFKVLVHEFAHAIWYELLSAAERGEVIHFYCKEMRTRRSYEYRLKNVEEFFAESFVYFITPHRKNQILGIHTQKSIFGGIRMQVITKAIPAPSGIQLKEVNIDMFEWLENKFRGIIDPELVVSKPDPEDEIRFDLHPDKKLYLPVTYSGNYNY